MESVQGGVSVRITTSQIAALSSGGVSTVFGLWNDRGFFDASTNLFPNTGGSGVSGAILKADVWTVSVAGVLGGFQVPAGGIVRALIDSPGQSSGNWNFTKNPLTRSAIAATTITANDYTIYFDATAGTIAQPLSLLSALIDGQELLLVKVDSSLNNVNLSLTAPNLYCGPFDPISLSLQGSSVRLKVNQALGLYMVL